MRLLPFLLASLFMVAPASASFDSPEFGAPGAPAFREYVVDGASKIGEPTIGIPWNTDSLFFHSGSKTIRGTFAGDAVTWTDVTPIYQIPTNLDPMLVADEDTGRIIAGGLHGPCSLMMYSDDDGETWVPTGNMCSGAQFDHQSIGIGPKPVVGNPTNSPQLQNAYYCGQLILIGCSVSLDGGQTWTAPTPAASQYLIPTGDATAACGGFHGHWRISRVTGTAVLPVPSCGDHHGLLVANVLAEGTEAAGATGLTFEGRLVAGSHEWDGGFDPSIGFGREEGWMYYGQADHMGARMALSKDEGLTWESLGGDDIGGNTWLDVGAFHDPPVVLATFADVQAGDDDRAAFTFMGLLDLDGDGKALEYGDSPRAPYSCEPIREDGRENREWHYFAAFTFDGGLTWNVSKLTDHPVQVGGVWDGGGGNPCRNLLDFNDMDIDSTGRVHIGYADGCIDACYDPASGEYVYSREPRVLRQITGQSLFSLHDVPLSPDVDADGNGVPDDAETPAGGGNGAPSRETPGFTAFALLSIVGAALALARRRA